MRIDAERDVADGFSIGERLPLRARPEKDDGSIGIWLPSAEISAEKTNREAAIPRRAASVDYAGDVHGSSRWIENVHVEKRGDRW